MNGKPRHNGATPPFDLIRPEQALEFLPDAGLRIEVTRVDDRHTMPARLQVVGVFINDLEPACRAAQIHGQDESDLHDAFSFFMTSVSVRLPRLSIDTPWALSYSSKPL
jgi:hypothetical protein